VVSLLPTDVPGGLGIGSNDDVVYESCDPDVVGIIIREHLEEEDIVLSLSSFLDVEEVFPPRDGTAGTTNGVPGGTFLVRIFICHFKQEDFIFRK